MFHSIEFKKKGGDIKRAAFKKIVDLKAKISERENRISRIKKDYKITDAALLDILGKFQSGHFVNNYMISYGPTGPMGVSGPTGAHGATGKAGMTKAEPQAMIAAGLVQNIITERNLIETEKKQIKELGLMARNIETKKAHTISFEELEFLNF